MRASVRAVLAGAVLAAGACGTDIAGQPDPEGVVATYRAPGVTFARFSTFALSNRASVVSDAAGAVGDAPDLVQSVGSALEARGFRKVVEVDPLAPPTSPPGADLAVHVTALDAVRANAEYWTGFPGYGQPALFGLPGFAWSYPWTWVPVSFQPGTVLVEIADLRDRKAGDGTAPGAIPVVWAALAYGVAAGGDFDGVPARAAVERAFAQSPYLATSGGAAP